ISGYVSYLSTEGGGNVGVGRAVSTKCSLALDSSSNSRCSSSRLLSMMMSSNSLNRATKCMPTLSNFEESENKILRVPKSTNAHLVIAASSSGWKIPAALMHVVDTIDTVAFNR